MRYLFSLRSSRPLRLNNKAITTAVALVFLIALPINLSAGKAGSESFSLYEKSTPAASAAVSAANDADFSVYGGSLRGTGGGTGSGGGFDTGGGDENDGGVNDPGTLNDPAPVGDALLLLLALAMLYSLKELKTLKALKPLKLIKKNNNN
jgi:hypothetical protein